MKRKLLILVIIVYFLEENNIKYYYNMNSFDNIFDLSFNSLKTKKESFTVDVSSSLMDKMNVFFTPYKKVLTVLFVLLIIIYIFISSNLIGFSKINLYIHLIYSLVLIYVFLLLIT
jgi:hypothetical protein